MSAMPTHHVPEFDALTAHTRDRFAAVAGEREGATDVLRLELALLTPAESPELATFRTEAARTLSGPELDAAVEAYAQDLAKRDDPAVVAIVECIGADELLAAVQRGRSITSLAELDARGAELGFRVRADERMTCPHCHEEILRKECGSHLLACAKETAAASR